MTITTRATTATGVTNKNAMLTNAELDANFVDIAAKLATISGTNTGDNAANSNYAGDYRAGNFVAGTHYLAPNGSAAGLTSFPTLNQNTTGNAATVSKLTLSNDTDVTLTVGQNAIGYVQGTSGILGISDGALYSQYYSYAWQHQIYGDYRSGQIAIRGKNDGAWQPWRTVRDTSNFVAGTDYIAPGGALGTPSSGVATNLTGTASGLTSGITNGLKTATTTVAVSSATAPTAGQVLTATGPSAAAWQDPSGGGLAVVVVSGTTQTAVKDAHYLLANVAATTVTLPASPASGDTVWVTWANSLTTNVIARNGQTIMGDATDMTLDAFINGTVQLRFLNSSWRIL